jgi:RimJ/RimL family protein N-acetyltransferase
MPSVIESGPQIGRWVADKLEMGFFEGRASAIGLRRDGRIIAGVIYENWNGASLMAHIVVEGPLTGDFIFAIFDYPFQVCGVKAVVSPIVETNTKSIHLAVNMGFTEECRLKDCHPDGDIVLYTLRKADCRFLGERYAKRFNRGRDAKFLHPEAF